MRVAGAVSIEDLRDLARRRLPGFLFDPMESGAGAGEGARRNVEQLSHCLFLPRALTGVRKPNQRVSLFGQEYASPCGISAVGYAGNYRHDADIAFADAARQADVPFILSGGSNVAVEVVRKHAPKHVWCQLYGARDPDRTDQLVARFKDTGAAVLVFTVDFPVAPRVENLMRSGIRPPATISPRALPRAVWQSLSHPRWTWQFLRGGMPRLAGWSDYVAPGASAAQIARDYGSQIPSSQTWSDLDRVRRLWPGKLVLKGIMHPADAVRAVAAGADGITVSNHGAVKLAHLPASIDVLADVVRAVDGKVPVLFDGGIRHGAHVLAACGLGASFCFIGRAALYGVAAGGRQGVDRVLELLRQQIDNVLAMIGCPSVSELDGSFLAPRP